MDATARRRAANVPRIAAPYLLLIAIVLAVHADPLVTGRVFFYRDLGSAMRPVLAEARIGPGGHDEILPIWTGAMSNGYPLVANPGYGLLEPLNLLFGILPFDLAFNLFLVLHVAIAGCAMTFLTRRLGCSRTAAFASGAAYALGGGLVSATALYWTAAVAWAPLVLAAGLAAAREPSPRRVALLALAIGLQSIGGQPEPVAATLLVGAVASLGLATGSIARRAGLVLVTWAVGVLGGLALAAPQLLPAARHARTTLRAVGFTPEGVLFNSLRPLRALWLVIPGLGGNPLRALEPGGFAGAALVDGSSPYLLSVYVGIVTVALAVCAIALARPRRESMSLAWTVAGLALLGVVLAAGRYVPGVPALVAAIPFPIPIRFPEKALYVTFLTVPLLAALGIDGLGESRFARLPQLLAAAVVLDLVVAHVGYAPTIDVAELTTPPLARELIERSRSLGIPDGAWRVHHERQRESGGWGPPAGSTRPTEEDLYRWQVRLLMPPTGAPYHLRAAMEPRSDHLEDLRYISVTRAAYNGPARAWSLALGEAGVLWVVSPRADLETATSGFLVRELALGEPEGIPSGSGYVYRNTRFVPRARLTANVSSVATISLGELPAMARRRYDGIAPWPPTTVVEAGADTLPSGLGGTDEGGSVEAIVEDHHGLSLSVTADRPAVLVVSDVAGEIGAWRARIDGRSAPVWRANLAYLAVPVVPGRHEVRLDYRQPGLRAGLVIMLVALAGCAAAAWPWRSAKPRAGC